MTSNLHHIKKINESGGIDTYLLDMAPDYAMILDRSYRMCYINKVQGDFQKSDFLGLSVLDSMAAEQRKPIADLYDRVLASGDEETYEVQGPVADGVIGWYGASVSRIRYGDLGDSSEFHLLVFSRDISQQVINTQSLLYAQNHLQLLRAQLSGMQAAFRHDANNTLHSILGLLSIVDLKSNQAGLRKYFDKIRESCSHFHGLIDTYGALRDSSHIKGEGECTVFNIEDTLSSVLSIFKESAIGAGVTFVVDIRGGPQVSSSEDIVFQVLYNLIHNAFKYAHTHIWIHIDIGIAEHPCEIRIIDDGAELQESEQARIFEPFYKGVGGTVRRGEEGAGLGLSIVRDQLCDIGAEVSSVLRPGETEFRVGIPYAKTLPLLEGLKV